MQDIYIKLALAFIGSLLLLRYTNYLMPKFYTLRYFSGYYTFQFGALLVYLMTDENAKIWSGYKGLFVKDYIDEVILAYFLFQTGIIAACWLGKLFFNGVNKQADLTTLIKSNAGALRVPLFFTALVILGYPFLTAVPGIGYANAILFNFLNFIPFVAGVLFFHDKPLRFVWVSVLTILFVLGILTGGRGTAVTCASMYAFGFYMSLETTRARRWALVVGVLVAIPLMSFLAFVGIYRHIVGRVNFTELSWERTVRMYDKYQKIKDSKVLNLDSEEGRLNGMGRLINYVNMTQLATVPSKKDHIGAEGLLTVDLRYSFDVAFLSGSTTYDRIKSRFGNFKLNDFGYLVNESTSVEYSIVTESYIRFGYPGIFVFAMLMAFFAQALEFILKVINSGYPAIQAFTTVMLCQQALLGYAYNMFVIMRNMIIAAFIAFTLLHLIALLRTLFKSHPSSMPSNA